MKRILFTLALSVLLSACTTMNDCNNQSSMTCDISRSTDNAIVNGTNSMISSATSQLSSAISSSISGLFYK